MRSKGARILGGLLIAGGLLASAAAAANRAPPLSTPDLLVDLARDLALTSRQAGSSLDLVHVEVLLHAALRLNPEQVDAHRLLEELAVLRGDAAAARMHLESQVALDAGNYGAFARWLTAGLEGIQTSEQRKRWLDALLALQPPRPRDQRALLYVELARLSLEGMQRAAARLALDRALGLDEQNPDAALLSLELLSADAPPHVQLRTLLRALRANPLRTDVASYAGALLDAYGFAAEAGALFDHVAEQAQARGETLTPAFLYERARNLIALGKLPEALANVEQAAKLDAQLFEAVFLQHWLLTRLNRTADADALKAALARRFAEIREPAEWNVNDVAQAAWFHSTLDPQPQRALMLAESAAQRAGQDVFAQRVLGWAQAGSDRIDDARRTLMAIAGRDAFAAARLARILRDEGDADAAARVAANLEIMPLSGPAYELFSQLGPLGPATQPAGRRFPEIAQSYSEFDRDVLSFQKHVGRYLEAEIRVENPGVGVGEPWWVVLSLTNRARFPITLGDGGMVSPVWAISLRMEGDRVREHPHLLMERMDRAAVLAPGQTIRIRRTIDVGPPGRAARLTPQQLQRVTVTAILDPAVDAEGRCVPSPTGQTVRPAYFNRVPATTNREALHALFSAAAGQVDAPRFQALEVMGQLLGERHRAELGQLAYRPSPIPADRIYQALSSSLAAEAWETRVRTLHALSFAGLDANLVREVQARLDDPNWLVRLMALRLLARQGDSLAPVCRRLAIEDTEELVRTLAQAHLDAWGIAPPQSQPTFVPESSEPVGAPRRAAPPASGLPAPPVGDAPPGAPQRPARGATGEPPRRAVEDPLPPVDERPPPPLPTDDPDLRDVLTPPRAAPNPPR
ncbi:MAG: hypothetical protein IPM64_04370 [Phycisphaerales bacterium]|nr:hypothetical protein [Phycisphaerales bacterium]